MLKTGIPNDNSSSKCNPYTFWTNTKLIQRLQVWHMIQKCRSNGFLEGTNGLRKPFLFPFPFFIEIFLYRDKGGLCASGELQDVWRAVLAFCSLRQSSVVSVSSPEPATVRNIAVFAGEIVPHVVCEAPSKVPKYQQALDWARFVSNLVVPQP